MRNWSAKVFLGSHKPSPLYQVFLFVGFVVFFNQGLSADQPSARVHSVNRDQMLLLRQVDARYQKEHGIHIDLKKVITLNLLGSQKSSEGELWLDRGQMRLKISKPEESQVIVADQTLWMVTPAIEGEKTQVLKTSLKSKQAQSQALVQLLSGGGVLRHFRVTGIVKNSEGLFVYFLQPDSSSVEFKRAQVQIDPKKKTITELRYWDQIDNETKYIFVETRFKQKISSEKFKFEPPQNSEITVF